MRGTISGSEHMHVGCMLAVASEFSDQTWLAFLAFTAWDACNDGYYSRLLRRRGLLSQAA